MSEDQDSWETEIDSQLQKIFGKLLQSDYDNARALKRFLFHYTIYRKEPSEGNTGNNLKYTYEQIDDARVQEYCRKLYDRRKDERDLVDILEEVFSR